MKHGLAGNQGTRQAYHTGNLSQSEVRNASANNNFYANIGVNAGYSTSKNSNNSHNESAVVTTMKPMNENSSITYNNVNNITYQGTQAQGGTFIYNNVKNIRKEAVELHNSSSSRSSNFGISTGATIGYGYGTQITGNGGSVSANRSNQNTNETIYQNGNFQNVNEVHNNTGTMTLSGFNQEGGKVTGNIGKLVVESRQNTSTTTGSSSGMSLGISANGVPSSLNVNGSRTNGSRAFVDNQSTFIVGEGSSLHVGTLENSGAVIGKEGNSTFKIDNYVGKDIQNHDTMKTTGGSIGISTEKPRITNVGFNQDSRDKQGITRNTVIGDVEIGETSESPINRDITRANEVTKDTHSSTNINVESQTIEYAANPGKLKEDIGKAKEEINDIKWAIKESIHDRGDDNRNFFGQLSEVRLSKTIDNITSQRLIGKTVDTEIAGIFKDAYKDLGYDIEIIFSDPKNSPQLLDENDKPKTGTAYVRDENGKKIKTIIINGKDPKNATKAGLIGTIVEEGSHVIGKVEGRQRKTGTDEKGLESTGRASNEYFAEKYKDDNPNITIQSDGKDYSNVDFGENVGDFVKDPKFKDGIGQILTINQLKAKYKNLKNKELEKAIKKDYGMSELEFERIRKNFFDKEKYSVGDLARIYTEAAIGYFAGKNKFLGVIGALVSIEGVTIPTAKALQGYGSDDRASLKMALSFEYVLNKVAQNINNYETNFVNDLFRRGGIDNSAYVYFGTYKLPRELEIGLKKGINNYNKTKGVIPVTYDGVMDMLQRDYYYRQYGADTRIYIERPSGSRVEDWKRKW